MGPITATIDGVTSLVHQMSSKISGEPIEDGRQAHDHGVSNPIQIHATLIAGTLNDPLYPQKVMDLLRRLHRTTEVFRVQTEHAAYNEMVIKDVSLRSANGEIGYNIFLSLQQILRVGVYDNPTFDGPAVDRTSEVQRGRIRLPEAEEEPPRRRQLISRPI